MKKRREQPAPEAAPGAAPPPGKAGRRRLLWLGLSAVVVLGAGLGFAASMPGHVDPSREMNECSRRQGMISSALLLWTKSHGGRFPAKLEELQSAGLLSPDPEVLRCPDGGRPYAHEPDVMPDMPGMTVVLSCPQGASHADRGRDRPPQRIVWFVGADLRVRGQGAQESAVAGGEGGRVWAVFAERLKDQRQVIEHWRAATGGDQKGRTGLIRMLGNPGASALSAWGMGASGDLSFVPILVQLNRAAKTKDRDPGPEQDDRDIAVARALLRLGDRTPLPALIEWLDGPAWGLRYKSADVLLEAFGAAEPPLPTIHWYLASDDVKGEVESVRRWWAGLSAADKR